MPTPGGWDRPCKTRRGGGMGGWGRPCKTRGGGGMGGWDRPCKTRGRAELAPDRPRRKRESESVARGGTIRPGLGGRKK